MQHDTGKVYGLFKISLSGITLLANGGKYVILCRGNSCERGAERVGSLKLPEKPKTREDYPDEETMLNALRKRRRLRPEHVMGILAVLAGIVLAAVLIASLPYMTRDEDPESLKDFHAEAESTPAEAPILEPTIPEEEPENPTIPPDRNPYGRFDFQYNRHNYLLLQNVDSFPGVDVSAHQGDIDWQAVKRSGIDFAIIRLGYRGYGSGKLVEDEYARQNLQNAKDAGLKIGAYFFSQALDIRETDEEIQFILDMLADVTLDMPIVLDWEIPADDARTRNMDQRTLTDIQLHFCGQMEKMGFQPMIYFNWHQSENLYCLSELEEYPFWLALYQDRMTYPWKVEMWQWTNTGRVPGINGNVDINVYMPH